MITRLPSLHGTPLPRATQHVLVVLWVAVIPALLAGLVLRYLVPRVGTGVVGSVAFLGHRFAPAFGVALFFIFTGLARYWRYRMPGGRYASHLPAHLVPGERDGERLATWARDAEFYELLRSAAMRRRLERALDANAFAALMDRLAELRDGIEAGDATRTREARRAAEFIAGKVLSARRPSQAIGALSAVGGAVAFVLLLRANVVESYRVVSESMLPTLDPGDHVGGNRLAYARSGVPRRGDVVVFRSAAVALGAAASRAPDVLVKRVVGLPGDRITMRGSIPVINGWEVPGCDAGEYLYVFPDASGNALHGRLRAEFVDDRTYLTVYSKTISFAGVYVVKPGEVFVLGDNRANSLDSRSYADGKGGGVPLGAIQARAQWFLTGTHRSGDVDLGRFLRPIDEPFARLRLEGVDVQPLETAITKCLQNRPADTHPPGPAEPIVARGLGP